MLDAMSWPWCSSFWQHVQQFLNTPDLSALISIPAPSPFILHNSSKIIDNLSWTKSMPFHFLGAVTANA